MLSLASAESSAKRLTAQSIAVASVAHRSPQRIPVAEPPRRVRVPLPPPSSVRATVSRDIRVPHGVLVQPPPMARPRDIDALMAAARQRAVPRSRQDTAPPQSAPLRAVRPVTPGGTRAGTAPLKPAGRAVQTLQPNGGTGINPWWQFAQEAMPGGGRMMVNVGTGNLLLQDDDMRVQHKGVPLMFRRTYNSQAPVAFQGSNLTWVSMYGTGWTNTFDAHIVKTSADHVSVFDGDGTRSDYVANQLGNRASGYYTTTTGQHAVLSWDGACGFTWVKKSGIVYYFYDTNYTVACPSLGTVGAYAGRLHQIIGRNRNTYLSFAYSWDGGDASIFTGKISAITVTAESGLAANLSFADVSGHRLLQKIVFPTDGVTSEPASVSYVYDSSANLLWVSRPPNNTAGTRPTPGYIYSALGTGSVMTYATSPRWNGSDGGYVAFGYSGSDATSATVNLVAHVATVNPSISDGTGSALQSGFSTAPYRFYDEYFATGVSTPTYRDTDGHATNWVVDPQLRATQIQVGASTSTYSGTTYTSYLVSNLTWDANNNLVTLVDPLGSQHDAAYDASGNPVAVADPTQNGYRPTRLFDYDGFGNIVAYCDRTATHPSGDWNGQYTSGSDSYCASSGAAYRTRYTYLYPTYQPGGEMTAITQPSGYVRAIAYDPAQQGGADFGLPTRVFGTVVAQFDQSTRQPSQSFSYDANGNVVCTRDDSSSGATTVSAYDGLNRLVATADPDDASMTSSLCSKTPGLAGSTITTIRTYYADGSLATTRTPSQMAAGAFGTAYTYDLDGDVLTTGMYQSSPQSVPAPTKHWYDGADRVVETSVPADPATSGDFPLLTRYIYDLTEGGTATTISGGSVTAHGNAYEIQKNTPTGWIDFKYAAFDLANRLTSQYAFAPCPSVGNGSGPPYGAMYCSQAPFVTRYDWDSSSLAFFRSAAGQLVAVADSLGEGKVYGYDGSARVTDVSYTGDGGVTPATWYTYDPDGRIASASNATSDMYNPNVFAYQYTPDGQLAQARNDSLNTMTGYSYYQDGMLASVSSVTSSLVNQPSLYQYAYRNDGLLQHEAFGVSNQSVSYAYTGGGRPTAQTDFNTSPSVTRAYDGHGMVSSYTTPAGVYGAIIYDGLGNVLQYSAFNAETVNSHYDVRGNLITRTFQPNPVDPTTGNPSYPGFQYRNIQGVLVQSPTDQYDGRTGAPLIVGGYPIAYDAAGRVSHSGTGNVSTYTYDAENRLVAGDTSAVATAGDAGCSTGGTPLGNPPAEISYAYDGRGVLASDVFRPTFNTQKKRQWFWDRSSVLYTVTASSLDAFQADGIGSITPDGASPGLTISDADLDGTLAVRHNATGHAPWYASNPYHQECVSSNPIPASAGYVDPFGANDAAPADDAFSDSSLRVTSVGRGFLSRAMGYTTPDYSSAVPYSRASDSGSRSTQARPDVIWDPWCTSMWRYKDGPCTSDPFPIGITGTVYGLPFNPGFEAISFGNDPFGFHRLGGFIHTIHCELGAINASATVPLVMVSAVPPIFLNGGGSATLTNSGRFWAGPQFSVGTPSVGVSVNRSFPVTGQTADDIAQGASVGFEAGGQFGPVATGPTMQGNASGGFMGLFLAKTYGASLFTSYGFGGTKIPKASKLFCKSSGGQG